MRSRWFHPPELYTAHSETGRRVGWLELFYDLIFVASFIQLGNALSSRLTLFGLLCFVALFTPLWIVWTGFAHFVNRFDVDDFLHRSVVYCQMFAVGAMAVTVQSALRGETAPFACAFAAAQSCLFLLFLRSYYHQSEARSLSKYWMIVWLAATVTWLVSLVLPYPYAYFACAGGIVIVAGARLSRHARALETCFPMNFEHLSERFGLMTIIVLGESFVKVLTVLADAEPSQEAFAHASLALIMTCALWWIYFDSIAESRLKPTAFAYAGWLYGHLPLHCGMIVVGVALQKVAFWDLWTTGKEAYRWLLCSALAATLCATALVECVTLRKNAERSRRWRIRFRAGSALVMLCVPLLAAQLISFQLLMIVALLCLAQVGFDMIMAPFD